MILINIIIGLKEFKKKSSEPIIIDTPTEILFVNIERIYQRIFTKYRKLKIVEIPIQVV